MKYFVLLMTFLVSLTIHSQEAQETYVNVAGKRFPIDILNEVTSKDGSMDDFAMLVALTLREYTQRTQFEACAVICRGENGWGASPTSLRSHSGCPVTPLCPAGTTPTDQAIHSHPTIEYFALKEVDRVVLNEMYRRVGAKTKNPNPEYFSEVDFLHPGYMVSGTTLYHQNGKANIRVVSPLPN